VRSLFAVIAVTTAFAGVSSVALADRNPSGTGPPSQSCQSLSATNAFAPGHSSSSPGSPFNEPGINSPNGGNGGLHYSANSQYDVACYQHSQHAQH
jgi:hypothetical protein